MPNYKYASCDASAPRLRVQIESSIWGNRSTEIDADIVEAAHREYAAQGHHQSLERLQQRGGFGFLEIIDLLYDATQRGE